MILREQLLMKNLIDQFWDLNKFYFYSYKSCYMKFLITISLGLFFVSCGNNSDTVQKSSDSEPKTEKTEVKDPEAAKGLELITKSDCFTCHKLTESSIGPSYAAVAAKYKT